jgi:hypothetical protein
MRTNAQAIEDAHQHIKDHHAAARRDAALFTAVGIKWESDGRGRGDIRAWVGGRLATVCCIGDRRYMWQVMDSKTFEHGFADDKHDAKIAAVTAAAAGRIRAAA